MSGFGGPSERLLSSNSVDSSAVPVVLLPVCKLFPEIVTPIEPLVAAPVADTKVEIAKTPVPVTCPPPAAETKTNEKLWARVKPDAPCPKWASITFNFSAARVTPIAILRRGDNPRFEVFSAPKHMKPLVNSFIGPNKFFWTFIGPGEVEVGESGNSALGGSVITRLVDACLGRQTKCGLVSLVSYDCYANILLKWMIHCHELEVPMGVDGVIPLDQSICKADFSK